MKKLLKIIGIILLIIVLLIIAIFLKAALTPMVPNNYTDKTETGGDIEAKYLAMGSHKVKSHQQQTDEEFKKYVVYYPEDMKDNNGKYPLVVFVNGSGVKASKYKALFRHLASWGFIVAGNEDESSGNGASTEKTLLWMLSQNEDEKSIFYGKIDTDKIGLSGHSQGGAGTLAAITETEHKDMYKTAVALSPAQQEMATALGWVYEPEKIQIPVLLFAGTEGDFEIKTVIPEEKLYEMYDKINAPKIMARRTGAEHGDMLYQADGYVTAWLMWHLQGDVDAAKTFTGSDPELMRNSLYQDQRNDY